MRQEVHPHAVRRGKQLWHANPRLPNAAERTQLATELSAPDDSVVESQGFGVDHYAVAAEKRAKRDDGVVDESVRRNWFGQTAAKGVNASRRVEDRVNLRVALAGPNFILPVHVDIGCLADTIRVNEPQLTGHGTDRPISKVRDKVPESLSVEHLTDIDKEKDLAGGMRHCGIQRCSFAAMRH
jgi:hypothetical protein